MATPDLTEQLKAPISDLFKKSITPTEFRTRIIGLHSSLTATSSQTKTFLSCYEKEPHPSLCLAEVLQGGMVAAMPPNPKRRFLGLLLPMIKTTEQRQALDDLVAFSDIHNLDYQGYLDVLEGARQNFSPSITSLEQAVRDFRPESLLLQLTSYAALNQLDVTSWQKSECLAEREPGLLQGLSEYTASMKESLIRWQILPKIGEKITASLEVSTLGAYTAMTDTFSTQTIPLLSSRNDRATLYHELYHAWQDKTRRVSTAYVQERDAYLVGYLALLLSEGVTQASQKAMFQKLKEEIRGFHASLASGEARKKALELYEQFSMLKEIREMNLELDVKRSFEMSLMDYAFETLTTTAQQSCANLDASWKTMLVRKLLSYDMAFFQQEYDVQRKFTQRGGDFMVFLNETEKEMDQELWRIVSDLGLNASGQDPHSLIREKALLPLVSAFPLEQSSASALYNHARHFYEAHILVAYFRLVSLQALIKLLRSAYFQSAATTNPGARLSANQSIEDTKAYVENVVNPLSAVAPAQFMFKPMNGLKSQTMEAPPQPEPNESIKAYSTRSFDHAVALVNGVPSLEMRNLLYSHVARGLIQVGRVDEALQLAFIPEGTEEKSEHVLFLKASVMMDVAIEKKDPKLLDGALRLNEALPNSYAKASQQAKAPRAYAKLGNFDRALEILPLFNESVRDEATPSVVAELGKQGKKETAISLANSIKHPHHRARAFVEIGRTLEGKGIFFAQARMLLNQGNKYDYRGPGYTSLVQALIEVKNFREALLVANENRHRPSRAVHIARVGVASKNKNLITKAHRLALNIKEPWQRALTLVEIAEGAQERTFLEHAEKSFPGTEEEKNDKLYEKMRDELYAKIGIAWAGLGEPKKGIQFLEKIQILEVKASAYSKFSVALMTSSDHLLSRD